MYLAQDICRHDYHTICRRHCETDTDQYLLHRKRLLQLAQVLGITKHVLRNAYREVLEEESQHFAESGVALNRQKAGVQGRKAFIEEFVKGLDVLESACVAASTRGASGHVNSSI